MNKLGLVLMKFIYPTFYYTMELFWVISHEYFVKASQCNPKNILYQKSCFGVKDKTVCPDVFAKNITCMLQRACKANKTLTQC